MKRDPELLQLKRRQLDTQISDRPVPVPPPDGWIRTIRTALGMSAAQLAKRLRITPYAIARFERNERARSITVASLAKVADALDCDVVITFQPRTTLERFIKSQAETKARDERNHLLHTMHIEAQDHGVAEVIDSDERARQWMTTRLADLWD